MNIIVKKNYLYIAEFKLKCSIGKKGVKKNKIEGDKTTPKGKYQLGTLYYRKDRLKKINSNLDEKIIKKNYGWCNDSKSKKYNKLIKINNKSKFTFEKLYRKDNHPIVRTHREVSHFSFLFCTGRNLQRRQYAHRTTTYTAGNFERCPVPISGCIGTVHQRD